MRIHRDHRAHAARVAGAATAIVLACYVAGVLVLNLVITSRLAGEVDHRLRERLSALVPAGLPATVNGDNGRPDLLSRGADVDDVPIFTWVLAANGATSASTLGAPTLPRRRWNDAPVTLTIGTTPFRFLAERHGQGWVVAGASALEIPRVRSVVIGPELVFGAVLVVAVFVGSFLIGLRASAPFELIRRRQAEFTADASHELRTPLSVIEAEVDLALSRARDRPAYEEALRRIGGEGRRLRRIVDDLLWLARTDAEGDRGGRAAVEVEAVAGACTERFRAVSERRGVALVFSTEGRSPLAVHGSEEGIDRLTGVLVDNALKHAGEGGRVEVRVRGIGNRVTLEVDDSGSGIPEDQVPLIFDRFHRVTDGDQGTGLGLAIADAVVQATRGTWAVRRSALGGAHMEVSWRRATARHAPPAADGPRTPEEADRLPVSLDRAGRGAGRRGEGSREPL